VTTIAVVDHGAGNIVSISQALSRAGADVIVADAPEQLATADGVVLPGVGRTGAAMDRLTTAGFVDPLRSWSRPLLGICVGLQLLFDVSDEDGGPCLGIVPGRVTILEAAPLLPHIGWNDVDLAADPLFEGLGARETFYFVHSYAPRPSGAARVIGTTGYGTTFTAAVRQDDVAGVQFHPERSGIAGLRVLANFVAGCSAVNRAA
jgi:imidazole glycerol-phosphate synthase subunit HisH